MKNLTAIMIDIDFLMDKGLMENEIIYLIQQHFNQPHVEIIKAMKKVVKERAKNKTFFLD